MGTRSDSRCATGLRRISRAAAGLSIGVGGLVFLGWLFQLPQLKSINPAWPALKANSAVCFILSGLAWWWLEPAAPGKATRRAGRVAAGVVVGIAALTLGEYLFDWNSGLDEFVFPDSGLAMARAHPGRIPPNAAICFLALGVALLARGSTTGGVNQRLWIKSLAATVAMVGLLSVLGHAFDVGEGYQWRGFSPIPIHGAALFVVLGLGIYAGSVQLEEWTWTLEKRVLIAVVASLSVLGCVSALVFRNTAQMTTAALSLADTMELRFHCRRLLSLVLDVESGSRGYLLSGQASFLAPFVAATNAIPIEFAHLYESEAGNPTQQALLKELEPVIAARLELARQAIASRGTNDLAAAAAGVRGGQAKALMDTIRRLTAELDDQIDTLRQTQQSAAEQQIRQEYFVLQLGLLLGLATLLGVLINLTDSLQERRRMEASLHRARSHYQNLLKIASDGIHIFDLEGKLLEASDSFYQMLGYSPQAPPALRVEDWDAQWSAAELKDRRQEVTESTSVFETRHRRRDGRFLEVEISTRVIDVEGHRYIYASSRDITERKRVAAALREQAEEFQDLYNHAPCGYHSLDQDGVIVQMNETELGWLGYRPEEVIGKIKLTDLLSERTRPRLRETLRQLQVSGMASDMEVELIRKDGSLMPTLVSSTAVRDAAGNFLLSRSTSHDITKRKQEWQRLMDSEARLVEAQKIAHLGSWEQVVATGQIRWSAEMYRLFGLAPGIAKLTPEQALAYAHPEDRERVAAAVANAVAAHEDYELEYRIRDANGVERHLRSLGHVVLDDGGRVVRTRGVTQDITEQILAETKLRQSEATYRNQFVHNTAVMLLIEPQTTALLDANDAALGFYGYTREQMRSLRISDLNVLPEPEVRKIVATVVTQKAKQFEFQHRLASGAIRDVQASVCPIHTGGRVVLHAIIFDISGRKQAEAEREQFFKFFNLSPDLMVIADPAGCFLRVNPAAIQLLGYTEAELLERPFINFIHPDDRPATEAEMSRQLNTGSSLDFVNRYQRKDGNYLSLSWRATYMPADGVTYATARDITEQRQTEAAVRVSEARYRTLVEAIPQKIFLLSRDLKLVSVNQNYARDLGCRPEDAVGKDDYDFFPKALAEKYRADDRRILETGRTEELEEKYVQDGHEIWVNTIKAPVRDRSGKIIGIFGIFWDITERKRAEAAVRESEARLNFALQTSHTGAWQLDLQDHTARRTLLHDQIFGYATLLPSWTYELFLEHVLPEDRALVDREFREATSAHEDWNFECRIRRRDGEVRWIWAAGGLERDAQSPARYLSGIVQDITQHKQAEQRSQQLAAIVAASDDAIFRITPEGSITSWNRGAEKLYGYTEREVLGQSIALLCPANAEAEIPRILERIRAGEHVKHYETIRQCKDRHLIQVSLTISPIHGAAGELVAASTVARDISAQKRAEAEILELNGRLEQRVRERTAALEAANQELESFAYSVSHDLRTPLRAMDGFSRVLLEDYEHRLDPEGRACLRRVRTAAQRMGQLIDAILMLSRLSREQMQVTPVNLSALVQEVTHELQRSTPERVVQLVVAPEVTISGDARLLRIALTNLLSNAWKFTGQQPSPRVEFGALEQAGDWVGFVRDNGAGFDLAYAKQLFRPFQRLHTATEFPGTGIGLAIVQRVIHRHGGRIWAEAVIDRGATFYFTLPAKAPEPGNLGQAAGQREELKHER